MHDVERRNLRVNTHEHGWNNREILGHVVGNGKSREHATGHGDQLTFGLLFSDEAHFRFRCRLCEEIIDTGFPSDRRRSAWIVPGNHHGTNTHSPEALEALADTALDDVLKVNNAEDLISLGDYQRGSSGIGDPVGNAFDLRANRAAQFVHVLYDRIGSPLANFASVKIATAHPRFRAEGNKAGANLCHISTA